MSANDPIDWCSDLLLDGSFVTGQGSALPVENPATEEVIASVRQASLEQLDGAVASARRAFESGVWRDAQLRKNVLLRMADLLEQQAAKFSAVLVQESGTPISLCQPLHIGGPINMLRYFAERAGVARSRSLGLDTRAPQSESLIRYEPVGVVGGIGAYNSPLLFLVSKAGAALAAGCTSVYMPSPLTPLATLMFGRIAVEAGVPAGVLNIVVGGTDIARALTTHPGVDKLSFTGSVAIGRQVMQQAAQGIKDVVLELGGKSAAIVLPGADLAAIAMPLHGRYLRNSGQGCQSPTRLLVPQGQFDDFIDLARGAYARIPVGDPLLPETMAGPLITQAHRARVEGFVQRALDGGARIMVGGGRPDMAKGWFMNPTLIGQVSNDAEIARQELFGPVAVVMPYRDVDQAVAIANDSELGLAAHVFGPLDQAKAIAPRLRAGTVYVNGGGGFRVDSVISGWKQSGIGREWGDDGIMEFLLPQHIQWAL
jgi:aldehyde dehydrogenase (NAD+)